MILAFLIIFLQTVDVCLSVFSFYHCLLASIILTFYLYESCDKPIAADVFGFLVSILYAIEVFFLKENAPENLSEILSIVLFVLINLKVFEKVG